MQNDAIELRPVVDADRTAILDLLAASLGRDDDPRFTALFAWKHERNPFGRSVQVVAVDADRIVGFRGLMRWRFQHHGRQVEAVRAVDTATHPDYQGRGIFTRLTLHAIEQLRAEGVGFIFNTPNQQSLPGYLKMGWQTVGRVPISVRPQSPVAAVRMVQARVPAERWSEPSAAGDPAEQVLADTNGVREVLASQPPSNGMRTIRTADYLAWRYGSGTLGYRALLAPGGISEGVIIFRVRRRGAAREIVLNELLVPGADRHRARALRKLLTASVDADYTIRAGGRLVSTEGYVRLPRQGPVLTWRSVCDPHMPALDAWDMSMGDIELF